MSAAQRSKYKYHFHSKKPKGSSLGLNLKGFLCTCNNREKECIRESYNLLNKYADILHPTQSAEEVSTEEIDIADELKKELAQLQSDDGIRRFKAVDTGVKNVLFISTTLDDPVELAEKIVTDIESTKSQQTKFLIRLLPIEVTCTANVRNIETAFKPLAEKYFTDGPKLFSIIYNHRYNNSLNKDDVIKVVADVVSQTRPDNKVSLKDAEISIVIEVIKGFALLGVVPNFIKYKKYNLLALCEQNEKDDAGDVGANEIQESETN